jgi:alkylhydroperoxidase family enzyme
MAWIRTVPDPPPPEPGGQRERGGDGDELAALYRRARDPESGRVDHILAVHSLHPAGLAAHLDLYRAVMRGTRGLPAVDRELIALVVSRLNGCHY